VQRIVATLDKVYASKNIQCRLDVDDAAAFRGDEGDLLEILGNLLDNAYKWSRSRVVVGAASRSSEALGASGLTVWVEDDGPGVPDDRREAVLQRGVRADQKISGHGIGLAVVQDIVRAYGGSLEVTNNSELGGARITLFFPER
jgi:two-component system sensor histidine kinase PhoQ